MLIHSQHAHGLEHWCIQRPERRNALGTTLAESLLQALNAFAANPGAARMLAITATTIGGIWIAGGDLQELSQLKTPAEVQAYFSLMHAIMNRIEALPLPVVIAIDGTAIGGGAEFCLAADLRIATASARFNFRQLHIGLATGYGGSVRLVEAVGLSRAQAWLLLGADIAAAEALNGGLIQRIVPDSSALMPCLVELAAQISALPAASVAAQKAMLRASSSTERQARLAHELELFLPLWGNPTHANILAKFRR